MLLVGLSSSNTLSSTEPSRVVVADVAEDPGRTLSLDDPDVVDIVLEDPLVKAFGAMILGKSGAT